MGLGDYFMWKNRLWVTPWDAFNVVVPIAFISTIYLWSYDQIIYIIPIIWIVGNLVERTKKYFFAFLFVIILDLAHLPAPVLIPDTVRDLCSILNPFLV